MSYTYSLTLPTTDRAYTRKEISNTSYITLKCWLDLSRKQIRQLRSSCGKSDDDKEDHLHAFGHSHLSWDLHIDGVRYVHVPLAYPREWEQRRGSLEIGTMQGEVSDLRHPVCIWDSSLIGDDTEESGFPRDWLGGWWSKYYDVIPREPHRNTELAPWAAKRFR